MPPSEAMLEWSRSTHHPPFQFSIILTRLRDTERHPRFRNALSPDIRCLEFGAHEEKEGRSERGFPAWGFYLWRKHRPRLLRGVP